MRVILGSAKAGMAPLGELGRHGWYAPDFTTGVECSGYCVEDYSAWLPHVHSEYSFIFCLAGRMNFALGGVPQTLRPDEMLVHNAGQVHQSRYGVEGLPTQGLALIIHESVVENLLQKMELRNHSRTGMVFFAGKVRDAKVFRLVRELAEEVGNPGPGYEILLPALTGEILVHLFRFCFEFTFAPPCRDLARQLPAWQMNRAMRYMASRRVMDFSLSELCREIGSSPSRFVPLFRNSTGLNPHVYFSRLLMEKGQRLLQGSSRSVKEVAYELGFRNPSHFCTFFHRLVGTTPRRFQVLPHPPPANESGAS